jgi:hypothetical protein
MAYTIKFIQGGGVTSERWTSILSVAENKARGVVACGGADRAEIYDQNQMLVFHYPQKMPRG